MDAGAWAGGILSAVLGAAFALDKWRQSNSNTSRQIKDDANASSFYTDMAKRVQELEAQNKGMWEQILEARQLASDSRYEASLWKYKFAVLEEHTKVLEERDQLKEMALKNANEDNDRLRQK